ncbi:sensor histidine kinase [Pseudoduganella sp. GCM10020061]|uniref:sensor histidine kinase n=1 Tax=Pseudoduganella sp. GCM10020061 TaxID=3317345 RepID=UPI00366E8E08
MFWLDCVWYFLITASSGGSDSYFVMLYVFPILVSSLRGGFDAGAVVTLTATAMFVAAAHVADSTPELPPLLFRSSALMALGYLMARLGENRRQLRRRLDLLHSLTQVANPHFGVDRAITAMLEKTRQFFGAVRCVSVVRIDGHTFVRTVAADSPLSVPPESIDDHLAELLLPEPDDTLLLYRHGWRFRLEPSWQEAELRRCRWLRQPDDSFERTAELLDACSVIGAPVKLRNGFGRVYVVRSDANLSRADAVFLSHVVAQAVPIVENMALVDRIASNAASDERKKFALNLHDTAVQPYIGLTLGLAALRKKAGSDNPLAADLERLAKMADGVIAELRAFAGSVRGAPAGSEPVCISALLRQAEQIERCYGVSVSVDVQGRMAFGDRISAEVVQIVREGLSNICRHTTARRGNVKMRCDDSVLHIEIDNDNGGRKAEPFTPRSICERAAALGGRAYVKQGAVDSTAICVEIPI